MEVLSAAIVLLVCLSFGALGLWITELPIPAAIDTAAERGRQ